MMKPRINKIFTTDLNNFTVDVVGAVMNDVKLYQKLLCFKKNVDSVQQIITLNRHITYDEIQASLKILFTHVH